MAATTPTKTNGSADTDVRKITGAVEDAVTYPILTQDITSYPPNDRTGVPGPGGGASLGSVAQETLRQVLGWRYRADDTKGFLAALTKAFTITEVGDHVEWQFRPQNYMVQADLGEITGAQASIYARAKNALDQSLPLLDGLTPLRPDADVGDMEAMRAIVRTELTQLVGELGLVGGPRVQRVDSLFALLLGSQLQPLADPAQVEGQLGQLADRFGLQKPYVNTVEDEQDLTNFLILVDYVDSLSQTWTTQRSFFTRGKQGEPFLGTQLVLLSQALDSLSASVQGAYDAMDSVFLGAAERQTTNLDLYLEDPITLAELLGWVADFSANEGRQLLQDAGKDGVVAFRTTINRLDYLVFLTLQLSRAGGKNPSHAFHTFRVQRALQEVHQYLRLTHVEAEKIQRVGTEDDPALGDLSATLSIQEPVVPPGSPPVEGVIISVTGQNIKPGATMRLISVQRLQSGYLGNKIIVANDGANITALFDLSTAQPGQEYTVVVVNPDNQYAWLPRAFKILSPGPTVTVDPVTVCASALPATLVAVPAGGSGSGYHYAWIDPKGKSIKGDSASVSGPVAGIYLVTVTDGNGATGTGQGTLNVNANPTVTIPPVTVRASELPATLTADPAGGSGSGYHYAWIDPKGKSIKGDSASVSGLVAGTYQVTVTDSNGCTGTGKGDLTVIYPPTITKQPSTIKKGKKVTFSVQVQSVEAVHYLWLHHGRPITSKDATGKDSETLVLPSVSEQDKGKYVVVVGNLCGMVVSNPVELDI